MRKFLINSDGVVVNVIEVEDKIDETDDKGTYTPPPGYKLVDVADGVDFGWRFAEGKWTEPKAEKSEKEPEAKA